MISSYYNEIDPYAAQWLRNLIKADHIAPGDVDERSIEDVHPDDLRPYTQCHFFAGIGIWSYALRNAGWPDDRPVWTGSCPCQPFSTAGKGKKFSDERHLWPAWFHLISESDVPTLFGEQVASKDSEPWIDLVQTDLEALDYKFAAIPFPSASVGAPHMRDRMYWVADASSHRWAGSGESRTSKERWKSRSREDGKLPDGLERLSLADWLDDTNLQFKSTTRDKERIKNAGRSSSSIILANNNNNKGLERRIRVPECSDKFPIGSIGVVGSVGNTESERFGEARRIICGSQEWIANAGATGGFWEACDWLFCRDGKWRPVEPGTFPLAHGNTSRVGRLRAYGNAINAEAAKIFIESFMECETHRNTY